MLDKISDILVHQNIDTTINNPPEKIHNDDLVIFDSKKELEKLTKEELDTAKTVVKLLNELPGNKLRFGFNDEAKMGTIQVFERENDKLIREFPSKEFFKRLMFFRDEILPGLIMDEKA